MRTNPDRSVWIVGAATIVVGIGSVMPWLTTSWTLGRMNVIGTDADGKVTILAATAAIVAIAIAAKTRSQSQSLPGLGLLAAAIVTATATYDTVTIRSTVTASSGGSRLLTTTVGTGLWIVDGAALALIAGALLALHEASERRANAGFDSLLPPPTHGAIGNCTVVVTMPTQRGATPSVSQTAVASE